VQEIFCTICLKFVQNSGNNQPMFMAPFLSLRDEELSAGRLQIAGNKNIRDRELREESFPEKG
jgi:hypothetical protein